MWVSFLVPLGVIYEEIGPRLHRRQSSAGRFERWILVLGDGYYGRILDTGLQRLEPSEDFHTSLSEAVVRAARPCNTATRSRISYRLDESTYCSSASIPD